MKIKISKIVGASNSKDWSQVHEFKPTTKVRNSGTSESSEPTDLAKTHGHLMAALSFKAKKEEIEVSSFGTEIIKRLQELYYSNESESVLKKVSQVMESLAAEFLIEVDLEMVLLVVLEVEDSSVLYAGKNGKGQVFLKRGDQAIPLIDEGEDDLQVVSGKLEKGDSLMAGTSQFFEVVAQGLVNSALGLGDVEEAVLSLAPVVHGHEKNSRAAAVVVQCENAKVRNFGTSESSEPTRPVSRTDLAGNKETKETLKKNISAFKLITKALSLAKDQVKKLQLKSVRVRSRDPKQQKSAATIALVLMLVFGVSLVLAGKKRQKTKQEEKLTQTLEEVNYRYDEAMELIELNPLRAKSLLKDAQETIKLFEVESEEALSEEMVELMTKVEEALGSVSREYEVESASEWFDFSLVKDGFKASDFEVEDSKLLVWDKDSKAVIELDLSSKASRIVVGGDKVDGGDLVGLAGERGFVVSRDKATVIDVEDSDVVAEVAEDSWGDVVDAVGFSSNLYLLDGTSDGQIYKYMGVTSGLSGKRSYLTGDSYDFSEAISMAIDGSVWVLFKDGTIVKYVRGVKDSFVVAGLDKEFEEPIKIFTSPEVDNLYILDRKSMRVVVISKSGEYQSQYVWPGIAGVSDLVVSEELSKIFLLTTEKVFTIEFN